jgi:hypothetical protein
MSTTPDTRASRIAHLDRELDRLVAAREQAHQKAFHVWSFEVLPRDITAPFAPADTLALDVQINDLLDELEALTDEEEHAS